MKFGIIDIGSNSVRLFVCNEQLQGKKMVRITQISSGLATKGVLSDKPMQNTARVVKEFVDIAGQQKVDHLYVYATEAVRSAPNGGDFCNMVYDLCGEKVQVLSGKQEAEFGFYGAYTSGTCCVIDIGGASTEIIVGNESGIIYSSSMPIGVVRIRDICGKDTDIMHGYIQGFLSCYTQMPPFDELIAIGGTAVTIGAISLGIDNDDYDKIQDHLISGAQLSECLSLVANTPAEERAHIKGLPQDRANSIVGGTMLLAGLADKLGVDHIRISCRDNMEGYLKRNILQK